MKSKKIISVIAAAVLAFGMTAYAATTMTLEEATSYALEHSAAYKSTVAAAKANEYAAKIAKKTYNNYHDNDSALAQMSISSFDLYLVRMGYVKNAAELQMRAAQRELERVDAMTRWAVRNNFYVYLSGKEKVKIAEVALQSAKERLAYAEVKHKQGAMSDIDYQSCEIAVITAENNLASAKRSDETNIRGLKNIIGFDFNEDLEVVGTFERNTDSVLSPEETISRFMESNSALTLKETLELAKERFTLADRWYFSSENEYWQEKHTYEKAQADYENSINNSIVSIYGYYDSIVTFGENITVLEKRIELVEKSVAVAKLRYEMGMITAQDYIEIEQEYVDIQNQLVDLYVAECNVKHDYKSVYTYEGI